MARRGDLSRIDLTVGDIAGGPLGNLPPTTTAANFGKLNADATPDDKALAIINMIAEVIGVMSFASARACNQRDIVLTGKLTRIFELPAPGQAARAHLGHGFVIPRARGLCYRDWRGAQRRECRLSRAQNPCTLSV